MFHYPKPMTQAKFLTAVLLLFKIGYTLATCQLSDIQTITVNTSNETCDKAYDSDFRNYYYCDFKRYITQPIFKEIIYKEITCYNETVDNLKEKINDDNGTTYPIHLVFKDVSLPSLLVPISVQGSWNITKIELVNLNISKIVPGYFHNIHNLTELRIEENKLTEVSEGVFSSIGSLKLHNLSHNEINKLSDHSFSGNKNLRVLDLSKNRISHLPDTVFEHQEQLEVLDLSHNNLQGDIDFKKWPMTQLKVLELTGNEITGLVNFNDSFKLKFLIISQNNITILNKFRYLDKLNASFNRIEKIDNNVLSDDLILLDLSYNLISDISVNAFKNSTKLEFLHLQHNNLSILPSSCFKELNHLKNLDLSHNRLVQLQSEVFNNSHKIQSLDMSNNLLGNLSKFVNVKKLNASFNHIQRLEHDMFSSDLIVLDLSHNSISEISVKAFSNLLNLESLYLQHNNLSNIPGSSFRSLLSLKHLDLSHNNLVQLQYGLLNQLDNLEYLDISYNNLNFEIETLFTLNKLQVLKFAHNRVKNMSADTILMHFPNLKVISLENNFWSCRELAQIVHRMQIRSPNYGINITKGHNYEENNVLGIACKNIDDNSTENKEDYQKQLATYFNGDFTNTKFYKYLESLKPSQNQQNRGKEVPDSISKYFEGDIKNSSFYKLLDKTARLLTINYNKTYEVKTSATVLNSSNGSVGMTTFNILFCIILLCVFCLLVYQLVIVKKGFYRLSHEQLELGNVPLLTGRYE